MGHMKDFDIRIRSGGDDAIAAVSEYVAEQEKLTAQLESMLDRCSQKLWVEWVPVAEQLPTRDQVVLVAWEGWELVTLGHFIDGDWFDPVVAISEYGPPTHWMPLPIGPRPPVPAPPKDGN